MTRTRWALALLFGFAFTAEASAQFFPVFGLPVIARDGVSFHFGGSRLRVDGFFPLGDPYTVIVPATPTRYGYRQVGPAYLPYGYYGYGYRSYGVVDQRVEVTIINPPALAPPRLSLSGSNERTDLSGIDLDVESPEKLWGKRPGLARRDQPGERIELPANQPKPPALPRPKVEDPVPEGQRFLDLGIAAFKEGEFGLALLRFRQAEDSIPAAPRAKFYQGQALIAMGKYREAAEILQEALRNQPNWPAAKFRPRRDLYGDQDDSWREHRNRLEHAQVQHPKDADHLFVLGYLAWFEGNRDTAVDYFTQSKALAENPRWSDLFLKLAAK